MLNKNVVVEYEEKANLEAMELRLNGKSLTDNDAFATAELIKKTGTLSAPEVTKGDLPSWISLKTTSGETIEFKYYVTPELVAVNGKTVDVFFLNLDRLWLKKISLK